MIDKFKISARSYNFLIKGLFWINYDSNDNIKVLTNVIMKDGIVGIMRMEVLKVGFAFKI